MDTLREARLKAGWTQEELAKESGRTFVTISTLENGNSTARNGTRKRIEKALGVRINWLKTRGLQTQRQGQMSSWENVEQNFRKALHGINSLQRKERIEFLKLAKQYLKEFEEELKAV